MRHAYTRNVRFPPEADINLLPVDANPMLLRMMLGKRSAMWLTAALTVTYALVIAFAFNRPSGGSEKAIQVLLAEGLFAGPLFVVSIVSAFLGRATARNLLLSFALVYAILSAITMYCTFGFEHDAQYQLLLLLIPVLGFPSVIVVASVAAMTR